MQGLWLPPVLIGKARRGLLVLKLFGEEAEKDGAALLRLWGVLPPVAVSFLPNLSGGNTKNVAVLLYLWGVLPKLQRPAFQRPREAPAK